ncbi:MAG: histidine kinase [Betaproteobacteria bacterium HGW-Betaproteobacteria-9]|nr:MAG: histidine kinase [Betaproteobacteria bacterium HGW-Betaproteobacteria-9]
MHADAPTTFRPPQAPPAEAWRDPLALLLASTGEGIYGVDLDGGCVFINPAGARLIGYEPEELTGLNMHDLTHHSRPDGSAYPEAECPIFNAFRQGLPCRIDSEVFWRRDGTAFPVEYSSHPIVEDGDVNWMDKRLAEQAQRSADAAEDMRTRMRCKCQNMSRLIENAVDNVGRIITDLRPSILDHQGLWAALEWQAQEFVQSAELALDWCMEVDDAPDPPEPLAMAVFRIFQEMLSNVGRHARAQHLRVAIQVTGGELSLQVQDDGVGAPALAFEAADAYGVMGMRERARHFGGRIDIASAPGEGTRMCLTITLPGEET